MISVITPTIRPEFLYITEKCLEAQTFKDWEWVVVEGDPTKGFTLPSDYNKALKDSNGNIIVSLQDCIEIPEDALHQINKLNHEKTAYTYPVGKSKEWRVGISTDEDASQISWDWRKSTEKARRTAELPSPAHWEIDFASAPKNLFFDVGGFDEDFNDGWSWENVEIAYRASLLGYKYMVSRATEGIAYDHDVHMEHPFRNKLGNNDVRATQSRVMADGGRIKLEYL